MSYRLVSPRDTFLYVEPEYIAENLFLTLLVSPFRRNLDKDMCSLPSVDPEQDDLPVGI